MTRRPTIAATESEDDSATEVTVTATLGGSVTLSSATEVTVSVGGGSGTGTGTFMLTPTQDSISEGDETIDVTGAATRAPPAASPSPRRRVTLTDDETAPGTITLTTDPTSVREDDLTLTDDETAPTAITLTAAPSSVREDDSATRRRKWQ
jgi:hypothetical protein